MSALHAYFAHRNQHAFQRALEASRAQQSSTGGGGGAPGTSGGKSWTKAGSLSAAMTAPPLDINARDWLGRTVLHLACAATDPAAVEYVRMILAYPGVNVNLQDKESMWTALHRALYHGNLASAIMLLQRIDTDHMLKDLEGYTAFDLYNSTVEHTKPTPSPDGFADLFTWVANKNATLGLGDDGDRTYPDHVGLRPIESAQDASLSSRLLNIQTRQIIMSKLHTVVLTAERRNNVRVCGFGSGGRLGPSQHTQYSLMPISGTGPDPIISAALGQDHTLILTKAGEVYSWGLNRFSQLGYIVEVLANAGGSSRTEEPIQTTPKKIPGLKGQFVKGVAASKNASACWTAENVYTWGTNVGQLGYDKAAQPVQISPRIVTKVPRPVIMVAMSDNAMACLLETLDVLCFANDRQFKINFPVETFPSGITAYKILQSVSITKITTCENTFAALSSEGEVFTFSIPVNTGATPTSVSVAEAASGAKTNTTRPQRVWSLRKKFSAAKDVGLGVDGGLAVCTESGHVYIRSRGLKGTATGTTKGPKFVRVPGLQRVVGVSANATGGYGALHVEYQPPPIEIIGNGVREDLAGVQPWLKIVTEVVHGPSSASGLEAQRSSLDLVVDQDEEGEDEPVLQDIKHVRRLCDLLRKDKKSRASSDGRGIFDGAKLAHGADLMVQVGSAFEFPAHRLMAAMRSSVLRTVLSGGRPVKDKDSKISIVARPPIRGGLPRLVIDGCRPMAALLLMTYLYSDDVPAIWDRRVGLVVDSDIMELGIRPGEVKRDLHQLARLLDLPRLDEALEPLVKRVPVPSLVRDVKMLYSATDSASAAGLPKPDVLLQLADRQVQVHSLILRARSPLFSAFFDDEDWTSRRWTPDGTITVNLSHLEWRSMEYVLRYLVCGEENMFENLDFIRSVDDLLDFMFEIKSAANELHIKRLMLICSKFMLQYINVHNVAYVLNDASYLYSLALVNRLHAYMAVNMETLLESRLLDDLAPDLIKQLSIFVRACQAEKSPVSRSDKIVDNAMKWFGDWLALQDIPEPLVPSGRTYAIRESARTSPPIVPQKTRSIEQAPPFRPQLPPSIVAPTASDDDVFAMDDLDTTTPAEKGNGLIFPSPLKKASGTWKTVPSTPKTDLKSIMAETKTANTPESSPSTPRTLPRQASQGSWRQGPGDSPVRAPITIQRAPSGGSPWKSPELASATASAGPSAGIVSPPVIGRTKNEAYPALGTTPPRPTLTSPARPSVPTGAGLGPVFSPSRQSSSSKVEPRRTSSSSGKVWSLPQAKPATDPTPSSSGLSFADIQAIQLAQALPVEKDKRSLREIQEEEQARQAEDDFLKWWAEEEARTKREMDEAAAATVTSEKKKRKARKPKELKDSVAGQTVSAAGSSTSAVASVEASPTALERPQHARKPPSQPRATSNGNTIPNAEGRAETSNTRPHSDVPHRGGHHHRPRGSFRGRGGHPRPVPQAI